VRLDIRRIGAIKEGQDVVGNRTRVKVVKNKVAPPFREAEFDIIYGEGVSTMSELVDLALAYEVIQKSGSWFSYGDERIGQGREAAKQWLRDNEAAHADVVARVKAAMGMTPAAGSPNGDEDSEPAGFTNGQAALIDF
jgi:recombination protein RecA